MIRKENFEVCDRLGEVRLFHVLIAHLKITTRCKIIGAYMKTGQLQNRHCLELHKSDK